MKLTLRAHHLLCLKGFQGYGYSENFTRNMMDINSKRKLKDTTITVIHENDDICKKCPNLKNNLCENKKKDRIIQNMDKEVLKHIDSSKEYNSIELFNKIDEIFKTKESVTGICFNCPWHYECLFYQNLSDNR